MADSAPAKGNKYKVKVAPILSSIKNEIWTNNIPIANNIISYAIINIIKFSFLPLILLKIIKPIINIIIPYSIP